MPGRPPVTTVFLRVLVVAVSTILWVAAPTAAGESSSAEPARDLVVDRDSVRLGDAALRSPMRADSLIEVLGPPEGTRYRLLWPGQGLLAVPNEHGEIEELLFVLCDGAPETARVGLFSGKVKIDGVELSCSHPTEQTLEALPEDFVRPKDLEAFAYAQRAGLDVTLTLSSWEGVLTLSLGFGEPDEPAEVIRTLTPD